MSSPRRNEIIKKRRLCSCFTKSVSLPRTGAHRCAPCRRVALFSDLPSWFRLKNFFSSQFELNFFKNGPNWPSFVCAWIMKSSRSRVWQCRTLGEKKVSCELCKSDPLRNVKKKSLKIKMALHPKNWCFIYSMPCRWMQLILLIASFAYDDLFIREVLTCLNCNRISFPKSIFE